MCVFPPKKMSEAYETWHEKESWMQLGEEMYRLSPENVSNVNRQVRMFRSQVPIKSCQRHEEKERVETAKSEFQEFGKIEFQ